MRVLITGESGFIGSALSRHLSAGGHTPVGLPRTRGVWEPENGVCDPAAVEGFDAVVHLAAESLGGRWTREKKRRIMESRRRGTLSLAGAVAKAGPAVFVSGSAMGFYGDRGDDILDESEPAGGGFLAEVARAWEEATEPASAAGIRTVLARTSLVFDGSGGSLPRMALPFKLGVGGPLGSGRHWWSWITLEDEIRAIEHLITSDLEGPVNLATPDPRRNRDVAKALGRALRRPSLFPAPRFALATVLGGEVADEMLLVSQRLSVAKLAGSGFDWKHPELDTAFAAVL